MHDGVRVADRAAVHAQSLQPVSEISILEAVREPLVEATDRTHVLRPRRGVPTSPAGLTRYAAVHQITNYRKVSNQETPLLVDTHPPETGPVEEATGDVYGGESIRKMPAQVYGATSQVAVTAGRPDVDFQAVPAGNAVSIEEHKVVTGGFLNRLVADGTLAKAFVLVPDMTHRKRNPPCELRDERGSLGTAPIIGDQKLEVLPALPLQPGQHELEAASVVVRGDNDGQPDR